MGGRSYKQFLEDKYTQSQSALDQNSNDISSKGKEFEIEENGDAESPSQESLSQEPINQESPIQETTSDALQSQPSTSQQIVEPSTPQKEKHGWLKKLKEKAGSVLNATKASPSQPITEPSVLPTENAGVLQKLKEKAVNGLNALKTGARNVKEMMKLKEKINNLMESADQIYKHIVNIIVVFILQTIIIPIFFLWAMYKLGIGFIRSVKTREV